MLGLLLALLLAGTAYASAANRLPATQETVVTIETMMMGKAGMACGMMAGAGPSRCASSSNMTFGSCAGCSSLSPENVVLLVVPTATTILSFTSNTESVILEPLTGFFRPPRA